MTARTKIPAVNNVPMIVKIEMVTVDGCENSNGKKQTSGEATLAKVKAR